jgi:aspartate 1-decarboxylase
MRWILRSKIHRATVTEADVNYTGSIGIDEALIEKAGFLPGEKVLVTDQTNGERLETYIIPEKKNSGIICMNGPSALLMKKGDIVIIMGFELSETTIKAQKVLVDKVNKFVRYL